MFGCNQTSVKYLKLIPVVVIIAGLSAGEKVSDRPWYRHIEQKELDIKFPEVGKAKLANGIELYFVESHLIPQASAQIVLHGGEMEESAGNAGITTLWGESVLFSGSEKWPRDSLSRHFENRGSSIQFSSSLQRTSISLTSLSGYFEKDLQVALQVLMNPRFVEEDVELIRKNLLQGVEKRVENPGQLALLLSARQLFPDQVRSQLATKTSLEAIKLNDLQSWHKKMLKAARITVLLSGDVNIAAAKALLECNLGSLAYASDDIANQSVLQKKHSLPTGTAQIFNKEIPQSTLVLAARGIAHNAEDYIALRLFDFLLGGDSFNSALTQSIRTRNGWSYSTYSYFDTDQFTGSIRIFSQTENKNVENVLREIKRLLENPAEYVNAESLRLAKISMRNRFVFLYERPDQYLKLHMSLLWDGMPQDYLATLLSKTDKVTLEQVMAISKKYYQPENFQLTLVGPVDALPSSIAPFAKKTSSAVLP